MENFSFKRFLSLVMAFVMVLSYVPANAFATEGTPSDIVAEEPVVEEPVVEEPEVEEPEVEEPVVEEPVVEEPEVEEPEVEEPEVEEPVVEEPVVEEPVEEPEVEEPVEEEPEVEEPEEEPEVEEPEEEPEVDELVEKVQAMLDALPELPSVVTQTQLDDYQAKLAEIYPYLETMTSEQIAQLKGLQEKLYPIVTLAEPVAKIGDASYNSLADAVAAAQAGDTINVIADIANEAVSVDKNLTITGSANANNVSINAVVGCAELTVSGLAFSGNSWINSGAAGKLTVSGVTANVTPSNAAYTNSRSAFISLGRSEGTQLELTVENSNIVANGGADPILGWACITKATLTGNTFGSETAYQTNSDSVKFMAIADGAEFIISDNTIYSDYNGIVFAQNTTRDNAYTATIENNQFYGGADHIWIEISGGNTCHATINAASRNTVNGNAMTVADLKAHSVIKNWSSYVGVDVVTDKNGKVIGGTLAFNAEAAIAEGYEKDETGKVVETVNIVAKIGDAEYATLAEAAAAAQAGNEIVMLADVTEDVTLPDDVTFNGNGFAVDGILIAAGDITFKGVTTADDLDFEKSKTAVNIGEGASLQLVGANRMSIGFGTTFNITGTITDAKTADKAVIVPSLVIPGASFSGSAGVTFNVTNAYIKAPSSYCSSSSSASGTFDFNIKNSIWESAGKLAFEEQSVNATVNFDLKDSVLTTGSHLVFGVSKGEVVIDNSNVNVGSSQQIENCSTMTIKNGSVVNGVVATSSNAKNPGTIIVENATYAVTGEFSGSDLGTGTIIVKNGANVTAGSITKANIQIDATGMNAGDVINLTANLSKFAGQLEVINNDKLEAKIENGKIVLVAKPVAKIGETSYASLEEAFKAATSGCTIDILSDVTVDGKWDCRDYATGGSHSQFKEAVTINGNGRTIKFTGTVNDGNWNTIFRFEENATVNNLKIDISEATGAQRVITAKKSLTVDGLTIIGSAKYGVIFGEGSSAADLAAADIVVKNSTLTGTRRAISDNERGKDVKSVAITDNTLNANVYVSASESITFNNNTANGEVDLRSYAAENVLSVKAEGNTLTAGVKNYIFAKTIEAQKEFSTKNPPLKVSTKAELNAAIDAAKDGDVITLTADIDYGTDQLAIAKAITLDLGGKTLTTRNGWGGMSVKNNATVKNGTIVHASNTAAIKVWNATAFEDLVIDVQGKGDANKVIGGIVLQEGSTTRVGSIKNVTIKGAALTNGIETYNCGDATENVIGSMENVTIDAKGTGMLISAPCGTATNCNITGGTNGIEIWIKGNYSASLELADTTVTGGVYAHDEINSTPGIVNNGTLKLTVDEATTGADVEDITLTIARAEKVEAVLKDVMDNSKAKLNDTYYKTFEDAMAAAKAGDTVTVKAGTYAVPSMKAGITIVGEGKVILEGTLSGTLDNLTLKNLHIKGGNAQRWAYAKGDLVFENVTFEATSVYALHFDGIAAGTNLTYKNCTIIGWAAMSGSPASCVFEGCTIKGNGAYGVIRTYFDATIKDCTFDVANVNTTDNYQDGIHAVSGAEVTVNKCTNANGEMTDIVNVHGNSVVVLDGVKIQNVAKIGNTNYKTLAEAISAAEKGATITFLADITEDVTINKNLTIDGANFKYTGTMTANDNLTVTVQNVNFVNGGFAKTTKSAKGNYTIKNCTFDGEGKYAYPFLFKGANTITIEDCNVKNYQYGFLYVYSGANKVSVKKVTVDNCSNYAVYFASGVNTATFENLTVKNSSSGFVINNTVNRTFTIKDCTMEEVGIAISESKGDKTITCTVLGENNFGIAATSEYAKYVLGADAVLTAPKNYTVTTNAAGYGVFYEDNAHRTIKLVAKIGDQGYRTLADAAAAAKAGNEIELLADATVDVTLALPAGITLKSNGHTINGSIRMLGDLTLNGDLTITGGLSVGKSGETLSATLSGDKLTAAYFMFQRGTYTINADIDAVYGYLSYEGTFEVNSTIHTTGANGEVLYINGNVTLNDGAVLDSDNSVFVCNDNAVLTLKAGSKVDSNVNITKANAKLIIDTTGLTAGEYTAITGTVTNSGNGTIGVVGNNKLEAKLVSGKIVLEEKCVATVTAAGGTVTSYASLQAAIDAAKNGETVTLMENIDLANEATVLLDKAYNTYFKAEGKSITIDLNGKTISGNYADTSKMLIAVFSTDNNGHMTLTGNGTVDVTAGGKVYSLIANYEPGCSITVENGTYTLDKAHDCLIYSGADAGENEGVTVKGGNFKLGNVGTGTNGKPWIFNVLGANERHVIVSGGIYNADVSNQYWVHEVAVQNAAGELLVVKANEDGKTWTVTDTVAEAAVVKMINGRENLIRYASFKDAVTSVAKGDSETTIKLMKDATISAGLMIGHNYIQNIVVDLNGHTLTSTGITLTAYRNGSTLTVKNGTVKGNSTSGTLRATNNGKIVIGEDLTVACAGGAATGIYVANGKLVIDNDVQILTGKTAIKVSTAEKDTNELSISAGKYKTAIDEKWCAEGYVPTDKLDDGYYSVKQDLSIGKVAQISETYYETLADAIASAKDGEIVKLLSDIDLANETSVLLDNAYDTYFKVEGKSITVDLNGKTISGEYTGSNMLVGVFSTDNNGHMTLTGNGTVNVTTGEGATVYSLIVNYEGGCSITVKNGTYTLDAASDSLMYSGSNEGITVEDGYFHLGNVGTGKNKSPWIFNVKGQNTGHVIVKDGSFNADILHQYYLFEVEMAKELALSKDAKGIYTVVPAVAYVTEREWSNKWYTQNIGYATLEEAIAACEGSKYVTSGGKRIYSDPEEVHILSGNISDVEIPDNFEGQIAVKAENQDALNSAVKTEGAAVNVALSAGTYTMPTTNGDVTISGTKDTIICGNDATAKNVTLSGVTVQSTGKEYTGIKHSEKVVYNDVSIIGNMYLYAEEVVFENCTFDLSETNDYIWVYGAKNVTFTNCTFNTMGKAILVFQDGSSVDQTVTVEGCTFNATAPAYNWNQTIHISAVSIDGSQGGTYNVILNKNTVDDDFNGLWQDKTNAGNITVTVGGETVLAAN